MRDVVKIKSLGRFYKLKETDLLFQYCYSSFVGRKELIIVISTHALCFAFLYNLFVGWSLLQQVENSFRIKTGIQ